MSFVVSIDGTVVPASEARVSVFDRGFLYGDSIFETIRTYSGKPFALDRHLARLARSAALVHIPLPVSLETLRMEVIDAVQRAGHPESYIRLTVTRGEGVLGLDPSLAATPRRVIIVGPLQPLPQSAYEQGVTAVTFRVQRPTDATPAEGAKIGNYLVAVLAMREAKRAGAHEALIVTPGDRVVEGASSNLFGVERGRLVTPPVEAGILAGITREAVLEVASKSGLASEFATPALGRLLAMDEIFVCSSIRELLPVVRVDDRLVGDGRPGPVTRRLHAAFLERVRNEMGL